MIGDGLGVLDGAAVFQIGGNAGGAGGMAAGGVGEAGRQGPVVFSPVIIVEIAPVPVNLASR